MLEADRLYAQADALEDAGMKLIRQACRYRAMADVLENDENKEVNADERLDEAFL